MDCEKLCANFKPKEVAKKNVAIIVGHTEIKQGATAYNGQSEYVFNTIAGRRIVKALNKLGVNSKLFFRNDGGLYGCAHSIKDWAKPDLTFELHFNAFSRVAFGTECLVAENGERNQDKGLCIKYGDKFTDVFAEIYRMKERHDDGVKFVDKGDRGEYNLRIMHKITGTPVALLFEPCFMNTENRESRQIVAAPAAYADNVATIIARDLMGVDND